MDTGWERRKGGNIFRIYPLNNISHLWRRDEVMMFVTAKSTSCFPLHSPSSILLFTICLIPSENYVFIDSISRYAYLSKRLYLAFLSLQPVFSPPWKIYLLNFSQKYELIRKRSISCRTRDKNILQ
jgi:hypothetical protein